MKKNLTERNNNLDHQKGDVQHVHTTEAEIVE